MKSMKIVALCAAFVAAAPLQAQNTGLEFGGSVLNHDMLWATDLAQLSQTHVFGTARVMGMGGAFTSLGADLSSMSLNPAGLGMYRRNEISLTPLVPMAKASTAGTASWKGNSKSQFAFANVGVALNVFESSRSSLTSLTLGIGMNRIADFNSRYSFSSESRYDPDRPDRQMPTIADIFSQQMNNFGVRPDREAEGGGPNGPVPVDAWNPNVWPAILAYDAYMLGNYGTVKDPIWAVERIGRNASVLHSMDVVNSGSINEFTISMGGNINNILYFGASIGIQSVHKKLGVTYQEEYGYFNTDGIGHDGSGNALAEQLDVMNLYQEMEMNGSGVNFKLGFTARPLTGLSVGVAFHTPTYYSLDYSYRADIFSDIRNNADNKVATVGNATPRANNSGGNSWDFTSPARLMFGASYTFGTFAIVSIDYERDWYNGIRVKNVPQYNYFSEEDYKAEFKHNFQGTNSIRAGVEVKPLPILALRVGGGYTDSMLKERDFYVNDAYTSMPTTYESYYFSAGAGVNLGRNTTLDLAYQYVTNKQTQYQLFFSRPENGGDMETWSGLYDTSLKRHYLAATLSFRF